MEPFRIRRSSRSACRTAHTHRCVASEDLHFLLLNKLVHHLQGFDDGVHHRFAETHRLFGACRFATHNQYSARDSPQRTRRAKTASGVMLCASTWTAALWVRSGSIR